MKLYFPITVDLYNLYPLKVMTAQQNNAGRGAMITLTAAGEVIDPSDEAIQMYVKKPDGTLSYIACVVVDGKIKADFTNQMLAIPGRQQVELQMISGSDEITTPIIILEVLPSNIDSEAIESQNEFTALQTYIGKMQDELKSVDELKKTGLKGDPGEAATLQIGTVTASAPGSDPVVTNSGTEQNAILNFVLPRGEEGPTGPPISTVNPAEATEADAGKAADAYYTRQIVGDLSDLPTSDKSSLVAAISEQNVKLSNIYDYTPVSAINNLSIDRIVCSVNNRFAHVSFQLSAKSNISFTNGDVVATGLPKPRKGFILYANVWDNEASVPKYPIRFYIETSGELKAYYTSSKEIIAVGCPACIDTAYLTAE